ncbi:MFS transporter [Brenneria goodwinii]|uniref:MFS transporter n=1 Tax=Brenneria goodwinii TaxID=1109412 RepID=UPI0036EBBC61
MLNMYRGLSPLLYCIALARFITALGSFVMPMMVIILHDKLAISADLTGLVVAMFAGLILIGSILGGFLCDKFKSSNVLILSMCIILIGYILSFFNPNDLYLIYCLGISQLGIGLTYTSTLTVSLKASTQSNRPNVISLNYLCFNLGAAIGPAIAGFLYSENYIYIYLGSAASILMALLAILFGLSKNNDSTHQLADSNHINDEHSSSINISRTLVCIFASICFFISFTYAMLMFVLPIKMNALFDSSGPQFFGYIMSVNGLSVILFTPLILKIFNKTNFTIALSISPLLYIIAIILLLPATSFVVVVILSTIFWSIGEIIYVNYSELYITDKANNKNIGRLSSVPVISYQLSSIIAPLISGLFIQLGNENAPLYIAIILCTLSLIFIFMILFSEQKMKNKITA